MWNRAIYWIGYLLIYHDTPYIELASYLNVAHPVVYIPIMCAYPLMHINSFFVKDVCMHTIHSWTFYGILHIHMYVHARHLAILINIVSAFLHLPVK